MKPEPDNPTTTPNAAVYQYPNQQEATSLWFHDHALGETRANVYRGLAAFYLLRDQWDTGKSDNPLGLPAGPYEREIIIQDRQFDTNGQLYFPDGSPGGNGNPLGDWNLSVGRTRTRAAHVLGLFFAGRGLDGLFVLDRSL